MISHEHPDFTALPGSSLQPALPYRAARPLPPLVQVASVARGRASTLPDTLRALQGQTLVRWTWAVVDRTDGSVRARDVMARLAEDPRVRIVHLPPHLVGAPLNAAAEGDTLYLCFLRPGDLLEPTALETWAWTLATSDANAISSATVIFGAAQRLQRVAPGGPGGRPADGRPPSTLFVTRAAFERVGRMDPTWSADEDIEGLSVILSIRERPPALLQSFHVWRRASVPDDPAPRTFKSLPLAPEEPQPAASPIIEAEAPFENPLSGPGRGVLFLLPYMFRGGAERAALDQATELAARGWRVTVVATNRAVHAWHGAFAAVTPDVHVLADFSPRWGEWNSSIAHLPQLLSYLIASRNIDTVILGGTVPGYGAIPWLRERHPHLAVVAVRHAVDWPFLTVECLPLIDTVLVSTDTLARAHMQAGIPADRVRRIVTGIDITRWRPRPERRATVRRWFSVPEDSLVLVYCSRLTGDKQPLVFAGAMAMLRTRGLDVYGLVTGDGPLKGALTRRLEELGIADRVRLLGSVDDRTLPDVVAASDVAFLPSQREGIALALLEGMACGLPFVGTSNSSHAEVVTPDTGALVDRSTPEEEAMAYADALTRILSDRDVLAGMGVRARATIDESWSFRRMGDQLDAAIAVAHAHAAEPRRHEPAHYARALAALSMHAVAVEHAENAARHARALQAVLRDLGYDHTGRRIERDNEMA